jgi:hypothetical protein
MRYIPTLLISTVLLLIPLTETGVQSQEKPVTPYGDFCESCSKYGNCKSTMSHEDAKKALIDYYHKKGLGVQLEKKRGRFIRAKITDNKKTVDVIIFDRKSGRIRSIY